MKKLNLAKVMLVVGMFMLMGNVTFAHALQPELTSVSQTASVSQTELPKAGIKPGNTFFFLDRFGEIIHEFFTFSAEGKARLQIKFAGERVAEINDIVKTDGPNAKGIEKAKILLIGNVAHAAEIIKSEKENGKDVTKLAKSIDDEFDAQERLLIQAFQGARKKLMEDRLALKISIAQQSGDLELVASLEKQIQELKNQDSTLKTEKDLLKESLQSEKSKIEDELNSEDKKVDKEDKIKEDKNEEVEDNNIENSDEESNIENSSKEDKTEKIESESENNLDNEEIDNNSNDDNNSVEDNKNDKDKEDKETSLNKNDTSENNEESD